MSRRYWADLVERVCTTYACAFLGLLLTAGRWHTMSGVESAAVGAIAAVLATVKGLLGRKVGDPESAGMLPSPRPRQEGPKHAAGGG